MPLSRNNREQIRLVRAICGACDARNIKAWLLGGWGIDALAGRVTREHQDVDLITRRAWCAAFREAVAEVADEVVEDTHVHLHFVWNGVGADAVFYESLADGTLVSDLDADDPCVYPWPPDSFPEGRNGRLPGLRCRAMSWEAQYVAKAGYAHYEKGAVLRDKDRSDLELIGSHLSPAAIRALASYLPGVPRDALVRP